MKKLSILLLMNIIFSLYAVAQSVVVSGKIVAKGSEESFPGIVVLVKNTNNGTVTDVKGNYSLTLPGKGDYELVCSFISFKPSVKNIKVTDNNPVILNFEIEKDEVSIEEVSVEAKSISNTSNSLIVVQKKTASIINGISSQDMSAFNDNNAGASLKRVTGISVQDGKYVYVRGLGDRYTKTEVNGVEIPSLDPEKNSVQVDLFPNNIIDNIQVYKTFSPNLPANFTGGYVNIITKEFPDKFNLTFSNSVGYNPQANLNKNSLTHQGGKTDYFGFDDGTRNVPVLAQDGVPYRYTDDALLDKVTLAFGNNMDVTRTTSLLNHSNSLSIGNTIKLFNKSLGYFISGSFSKKYSYYSDGHNGKYVLTRADAPFLQEDISYNDEKAEENALIGVLANASLKINKNNKIGLSLIFNHSGDKVTRYQEGYNLYHDVFMQTRTLHFKERSFFTGQLKGQTIIPKLNDLKINWISSYSTSNQSEPDLRFFTNIYQVFGADTVYTIDIAKQDLPSRYFREMSEMGFNNKIDFEYGIPTNNIKFMFGVASNFKTRSFREKLFLYADNNSSFSGSIPDYLSENNIGLNSVAENGDFGVFIKDNTQLSSNYDGVMSVISSYLMGNIDITKKIKLMVGVRAEKSSIFVDGQNPLNPDGKVDNTDFLPVANLNFDLSERMKLKTVYSKTIARPSFRELAPYASYEFVGDFIFVGNENLQETKVDNFDIRWELYPNSGQIFSVGYFYKQFINPIERTFNPQASNNELTVENAPTANVHGVEVEFKTKIGNSSFIKDFFIGGNFTYVNSIVAISEAELSAIRATNPLQGPTREMYGQAPYIVNSFIMYNNSKIGLQTNLNFNISGDKLAIVVKGGTPDIYEKARPQADFNLQKRLGKRFNLNLSVSNIFNASYSKTYTYKDVDYLYSSYKLGQSFTLGLKYDLN